MTTLVYPATLTPNSNENVNDLNSNLNAIAAVVNGGIDSNNIASGGVNADRIEVSNFFPMRAIADRSGMFSGIGAAAFLIGDTTNIINSTSVALRFFSIVFDPADYAITGRTLRLRTRAMVVQNQVSAGINLTVALYVVTPASGLSGSASTGGGSIGQVSGSTVNISPGGSNTSVQGTSADYAAPVAGLYALAVVSQSGTQAAGSVLDVRAQLQYHHV